MPLPLPIDVPVPTLSLPPAVGALRRQGLRRVHRRIRGAACTTDADCSGLSAARRRAAGRLLRRRTIRSALHNGPRGIALSDDTRHALRGEPVHHVDRDGRRQPERSER